MVWGLGVQGLVEGGAPHVSDTHGYSEMPSKTETNSEKVGK